MAIPNIIRYEAQLAKTGRAFCKICGGQIGKDDYVFKILGFRINQSLHPDCVAKLILTLSDVLAEAKAKKEPGGIEPGAYVARAIQGRIKLGYYQHVADKQYRFTTLKVVDVVKKKEATSNG